MQITCRRCGNPDVLTMCNVKLDICYDCVEYLELMDLIKRKENGENINLKDYSYLITNNKHI